MIAVVRVLQVMALAIGVGSIVFLSFVVAPSLFGALPREMAGRATAAIFPRYHLVVGGCAAAAIVAVLLQALLRGGFDRRLVVELALLVAMAAPGAYGGAVVLPRAAAARAVIQDPDRVADHAAARAAFGRLHRRSVALNGAALAAGLAALAAAALPLRATPP